MALPACAISGVRNVAENADTRLTNRGFFTRRYNCCDLLAHIFFALITLKPCDLHQRAKDQS